MFNNKSRSNSREPVITDYMELWHYCTSWGAQNKQNCTSILVRDSHIDRPLWSGSPLRNFLPVLKRLLENIYRTTPHMQVKKLLLRSSCLGKEIRRWETSLVTWYMIVQKTIMFNCHGPKHCISNIRPVDTSMNYHFPCYRHDCSNSSLSNSIVMMGSNSGKSWYLIELGEMCWEFLWCKWLSIVRDIFLWTTPTSLQIFL